MTVIADFIQLMETLGGFATVFVLLLLLLFYIGRKAFKDAIREFLTMRDAFTRRLDRFEAILNTLSQAALSEEGQAISQAKQLDIINKVYSGLDTHSTNCFKYHSELTVAMNDLTELRKDIDQFMQDGKESRAITQSLVSRLDVRLDTFMEKILEIIRNLSDFGARRGDN